MTTDSDHRPQRVKRVARCLSPNALSLLYMPVQVTVSARTEGGRLVSA
jgi:hypothetical protein